jgi:hypothetical protein
MRVLLWSDLFWPYVGGPEILAARLMPALRDRGHEFLVVTSHDSLDLPDEARYEGIPVRRFPFRAATASGDLAGLRALRSEVAALKRAFAPRPTVAVVLGAVGVLLAARDLGRFARPTTRATGGSTT